MEEVVERAEEMRFAELGHKVAAAWEELYDRYDNGDGMDLYDYNCALGMSVADILEEMQDPEQLVLNF